MVGAAYGSAGERCMAIATVVTVGDSAEPLLEKLLPRIDALKVGPGTDNNNDMGRSSPRSIAIKSVRISTWRRRGREARRRWP